MPVIPGRDDPPGQDGGVRGGRRGNAQARGAVDEGRQGAQEGQEDALRGGPDGRRDRQVQAHRQGHRHEGLWGGGSLLMYTPP